MHPIRVVPVANGPGRQKSSQSHLVGSLTVPAAPSIVKWRSTPLHQALLALRIATAAPPRTTAEDNRDAKENMSGYITAACREAYSAVDAEFSAREGLTSEAALVRKQGTQPSHTESWQTGWQPGWTGWQTGWQQGWQRSQEAQWRSQRGGQSGSSGSRSWTA